MKPSNPSLFCAKRAWDQPAESQIMLNVERDFQELASKIVENKQEIITEENGRVINDFFMLWFRRSECRNIQVSNGRNKPIPAIVVPELPGNDLTDEEKINVELNGYSYSENGLIPGPQWAGLLIRTSIFLSSRFIASKNWGIVYSDQGEFLVPDSCSNELIIPISPRICLIHECSRGYASQEVVTELNKSSIAKSREYYFGRDLAKCPGTTFWVPR